VHHPPSWAGGEPERRRLTKPVFDLQTRYSAEFTRVVGDENAMRRESMRGDECVEGSNRNASVLQMRAQSAVAIRCGVVERQHGHLAEEHVQVCRGALGVSAFRDPEAELGERDGADSELRGRMPFEMWAHAFVAVQNRDARVRVEQELQIDFRFSTVRVGCRTRGVRSGSSRSQNPVQPARSG
jgi:hypothetical protein